MDATSDGRRSPSEPSEPAKDAPGSTIRIVCRSAAGTSETDDPAALAALVSDPDARIWVDLIDPPPDVVKSVARILGLHPLVVEDIAERNDRAKVANYDDVLHVVLFDLDYRGEVQPVEIDLVLGKQFLLSVRGADADLEAKVPLHDGIGSVLAKGPDFLLYMIADHIIDGYFPVLDRLADEIDELQDRVVAAPSDWTLQRLFVLKKELLAIRRATSPAREVLNQLTNRDLTVISENHIIYFRDVYDHLIRVTDELDNYRELVSGTLDIYLSTVNNNLSVTVKRLTGVTVILAGIGAGAGIFGMSEAGLALSGQEASGFWLVAALIVVAAAIAAVILRRLDWI
jgi:magnesium transporter